VLESLRNLLRHRALLRALTTREVRARYRGSVLGLLWSFLNPLLLLVIYSIVFGLIFQPRLGSGPQPYAVFLFTGLLPWTWFAAALLEGANSITGGGALLKKVVFPAEVLPLVSVLANGVHFLVALPVLALVLLVQGQGFSVHALAVIPVLLVLFAFTAGLTLAVSALTVLFRDVRDLLNHAVTLGFFATPIIYESSMLPESLRSVLLLNPMPHIMESWHAAVFFGRWPDWRGLGVTAVLAVVVAALGYWLFDRLREVLPEEV